MKALGTYASGVAKFAIATIGCGLLGSVSGAILGALAGLPFFPPAGPFIGSILGAVGGLVAGLMGGGFRGHHRFRTGGIVGALVAITMFPYMIFLVIPPSFAVAAGYLFGDYLDREVNKENPGFFLARILKRLTLVMDSCARWINVAYGIVSSAAIIILLIFLVRSYVLNPN